MNCKYIASEALFAQVARLEQNINSFHQGDSDSVIFWVLLEYCYKFVQELALKINFCFHATQILEESLVTRFEGRFGEASTASDQSLEDLQTVARTGKEQLHLREDEVS